MELKGNNKTDIASECAIGVFCDKNNLNYYYGLTKDGTFKLYPENICIDTELKKKYLEDNVDSKGTRTPGAIPNGVSANTVSGPNTNLATSNKEVATATNKVSPVQTKRKFTLAHSPNELLKSMKINDTKIQQDVLKQYDFTSITLDNINKTITKITDEINELEKANKDLENANKDLNEKISSIKQTDNSVTSLIGLNDARRKSNIAIIVNKRKSIDILNQIKPLAQKKGGKIRKTKRSKKTKRLKTKKLH
jgi:hypothetical protein